MDVLSGFARGVLAAIGVVLMIAGAAMFGMGVPGFGPLILGAAILVGVAFERWRYKPVEGAPEARFAPTDERFLDPTSGERVRVWIDARTGERRYVRDDAR